MGRTVFFGKVRSFVVTKPSIPMVAANVNILADLQAFLLRASEDASVRTAYTTSQTAFTRKRKLPFARVVLLIVGLLKRSLSVEIGAFFQRVVGTTEVCSKAAFCEQRRKLKPSFFVSFNERLVESFYEHYAAAAQRWRGFRLLACDGSTAYLPQGKAALRAHFGVQVNQFREVVMARVVQVEDVLNHLVVRAGLYPITTSEQQVVYQLVGSLYADSVVLLDRNFGCFAMLYLLMHPEVPLHFVIRCKTRGVEVVEKFLKSRKASRVVQWCCSAGARAQLRSLGHSVAKDHALRVRLVKVRLAGGEVEVLATNLYDQRRYTAEDLKELYGLRWGVETTFGCLKNPLQLEEFSGLTVCAIEQDYAASVLVQNLQRLVEQQCTTCVSLISSRRRHRYQVNRAVSFAALKEAVPWLLMEKEVVWILLALQRTFEQHLEPVRPGRLYPRTQKHKRIRGRFQTYTNFKRPL